jgi:hypothetical protein
MFNSLKCCVANCKKQPTIHTGKKLYCAQHALEIIERKSHSFSGGQA